MRLTSIIMASLPLSGLAFAAGFPGLQSDDKEASRFDLQKSGVEATVTGKPGEERLSIYVKKAEMDAVLNNVGAASGRVVRGLDLLSEHPTVTANLKDEDLRDALSWIGGSVGMRITLTASEIRIKRDLPINPDRRELFGRAFAGYTTALRDHPDSDEAPKGAWNRARIEAETPGRELEAARIFDQLIEDFPRHDLVPDALLEAGQLFGKANAWDEAAARFDKLASHPREHGHSVSARRLLADAYANIAAAATEELSAKENARRAIYILDALDDDDPTRNMYERRDRALVRSRAESLVGEHVKALKALDIAERYSDLGANDTDVSRQRALAFARSKAHGRASRAWMRHATLVEGEERAESYAKAAEEANKGQFHLGAIFIAKHAENEGLGELAKPQADAAYIALDINPPSIDYLRDTDRLTRGMNLIEKEMFDQAIDALRPIYDRRSTLNRDDHFKLAMAYSKALAAVRRIDEAMLVLRKCAGEMVRGSDRREIYLFASRLLEDADEVERAIAALEGRL